jgi:hypothetical protein
MSDAFHTAETAFRNSSSIIDQSHSSPGASREDVEGDGWVGFAAVTTEGDEVVVAFSLESFDHPTNEVRGDPRLRPDGMSEFRVSGFSPPRRWGTRWWWYGQMWATRPDSG